MEMPESLALEVAQRSLHLASLLTNDVRTEGAVGTQRVPRLADSLRQIEHDRNRQDVE